MTTIHPYLMRHMMKKMPVLLSALSLVALFFFSQHFAPQSEKNITQLSKPHAPSSVGTADDPAARLRWETMRLKDPATGTIPPRIRKQELAFAKNLPAKGTARPDRLEKGGQAQALQWVHRGPFNVGGRTRALALDVDNENIILAGGVSGGMWRSDDGGNSWQRTTDLAVLPSVTSIAQDTRPGKTNVWYYGTGELFGSASGSGAPFRGDGIFKSTDGGFTWDILPVTATDRPHVFDQEFDYVWHVLTDPSNPVDDEVYAALYGQVKRSLDGGQSWQTVLGQFDSQFGSLYTEIAITSTGVLYATLSQVTIFFGSTEATTKGIFRSEDGALWTDITPPDWPQRYNRVAIGIAPSNENIVYFLANTPRNGKNEHQIWKYTYLTGDGAGSNGTWEDRSDNLPGTDGSNSVSNFDSQSSYDLVVKVKPNNPDIVFIGGTNLYRSSNGFASVAQTSWIGGYNALRRNFSLYPGHHPDQHAIVFSPSNPNVMYSAHDGGISRTDNNTQSNPSWIPLNNGYLTTQFYTVALNPVSSNNFVMGGTQDNGTWGTSSTNPASEWDDLFGGDGSYCAVAEGGSVLIVSTQNARIYRLPLEDFVSSFARLDPEGLSDSDFLFINPFVLDNNNSSIMYLAGGTSVWRNSDIMGVPEGTGKTSVNWDELTDTRLPNAQSGARVSSLATSTTPANILYFGTTTGEIYKVRNAHAGQPTAQDITDSSFPQSGYLSCIAVDPTDGNRVFAVFSNYNVQSLFYTTSGGDTWEPVGGNLEANSSGNGAGPSVRWAAILPFGGNTTYFAGTSTGLYSTNSLQGMATIWEQEGANSIGNTVVDMVVARPGDGKVVVATHGRGIFSSDITTSVAAGVGELPADFALQQNYPNPFNPSTAIRYQLPVASDVELSIYSLTGKYVRTLVQREMAAGSHSVQWNGLDQQGQPVASGVYLMRLRAGDFTATRKMTLAR